MGAASYIGRVGGLAVALGVGTAIATGHGVASADDAGSAAPNSSTADRAPTGGAAAAKADADPDTTPTDPPDAASPASKTASQSTGTTTTSTPTSTTTTVHASTQSQTLAGGVTVNAQTNTGSSGSTAATTKAAAASATPAVDAPPPAHTAPIDTTVPADTAAAPKPTPTEKTEEPPASEQPGADQPAPTVRTSGHSAPDFRPVESTDAAAPLGISTLAPPQARSTATTSIGVADPLVDSGGTVQQAKRVAVFADPRSLAASSTRAIDPQPTAVAPWNPVADVVDLVSNVIGWVTNSVAGANPATPAQPPLAWTLLAFARRELDNVFATFGATPSNNVMLAAAQTVTNFALAAVQPVPPRPAFPIVGQQLSPSTRFVDWVSGNFLPNNTYQRYGIWGTDVGTMWDNGIPDDPKTPDINEHQVLIAFGDTFGGANMTGTWRFNTLFRSSDAVLADGIAVPDGQWLNGNMFGGAPLWEPTYARQIILPERLPSGLPVGVTLIPTAGISVPTPGTQFGATQYLSFMSVQQWGAPGQWTTNYSAIAYSTDNGENWYVSPSSVRQNQAWTGNQNFQQSAFVRPGDGYVYMYGTPNGRQGAAYVSRVLEKDILDVSKYDYYSKGQAGWFWSTPAGWYRNNPAAATPVFGADGGACGIANAGNQVSEMSVQYNKQLNKYVTLYGDQFNNIVMRTSDTPQGNWSTAKVLMGQQNGGIYAPMMHPWSPSTMGTGTDLYWNLSLWSEYNVMLMRTDLTKV